jgi:hypothetical protein
MYNVLQPYIINNHTNRTLWRRILLGMNEPRDSKVWSEVDRIFAEDRRWHGLELQSFTMQLLCSCSYREFFKQGDEYGFEETSKDQMIDPGLDKMAGGFVDVSVILVHGTLIRDSCTTIARKLRNRWRHYAMPQAHTNETG